MNSNCIADVWVYRMNTCKLGSDIVGAAGHRLGYVYDGEMSLMSRERGGQGVVS